MLPRPLVVRNLLIWELLVRKLLLQRGHRSALGVLIIIASNLSSLGFSGVAQADVSGATMPLAIGATANLGPITGQASNNDTARRWGIHGTDLGHMFWHGGKLHMVFGDTFDHPGLGGRNWRSNAMAIIADPDPRHGLGFERMITGPDGFAKELLASRKVDGEEKTVIPTYGVSLGSRMYLHYMSVRNWGEHGRWVVGHSGIAYSDDDGATWHKPPTSVWTRNSGFEQVAFVVKDDLLYTFGIGEGRWSGVRLRRVAVGDVLDREAYRFWDGSDWVPEPTAAIEIVPAPAGELSVAWSEAHRSWLMLYLHPQRKAVVLRTAPRLVGPWSGEQVVASAAEYPGLYAPYIVPGSEIDTDVHYTLSLWGPYNVFLMRTTLHRVDAAVATRDRVP